jgi:hypothetical protein
MKFKEGRIDVMMIPSDPAAALSEIIRSPMFHSFLTDALKV